MALSRQVHEIQSTLDIILAKGPVPISVLQTALSLAQNPQNLSAFAHQNLIESCMHLLRTHTGAQRATFQLTCLRVLAVSLLTLLLGTGVEGFVEFAAKRCLKGENCLTLLGGHVSYMQLEGMKHIETIAEGNAGVRAIADNDAEYLIEFMYSQRDVILAERTQIAMYWQGFTSLLCVLWYRITRTKKKKRVALHLRDLVCRFSLISSGPESKEDLLLFSVIDRLDRSPGDEYQPDRSTPADHVDMRTIVEAYVKRVTPTPGCQLPPLGYCKELLQWAALGLGKDGMPTWDMFVLLIEASIPRLWVGLEDLNKAGPLDRIMKMSYALEIFAHVRSFMQARIKEEDRVRLVSIFMDSDWVNLVGRVLLLGAPDGPSPDNDDILENAMDMIRDKKQAVEMASESICTRWKPSPQTFDDMRYDWLKVYKHLEVPQAMYTDEDDFYSEYLYQSHAEWLALGGILGFTRRLDSYEAGCANPRCSGVHEEIYPNACGGCGKIPYGSLRCQKAHWSYPFRPHSEECSGDL